MISDVITGAMLTMLAIIMFLVGAFTIQKWGERRDKKRIRAWLHERTKHLKHYTVGSPELTKTWPSTTEISSATDITEERVRHICGADNKVQQQRERDIWHNQILEERWTIKTFVRD